jgi:predicted lipoprotein with Yx(FWY)xxD motif
MSRSKSIIPLAGAAAITAMALFLAGCSSQMASGSTETQTSTSGHPGTVDVATSGLGQILVDSQGRTLYLFQKDTGTQSECTGACASSWPPLRTTGKPTVGSGASASDLGTTSRSDGNPQVTYNGHPLYLFSGDQQPGDTNGEGTNAFGGLWYAVSPAGNQVVGQASSSTGGGGFSY